MDIALLLIITVICGFITIISIFAHICVIEEGNDEAMNISGKVCYISVIICFLLFILCCVASYKLENKTWIIYKEPYKIQNIVALGDSNQVNGRFYARRGYIGEVLYYQYMVERANGGFIAGKAKANDAVLYYTDEDFRVEWYELRRRWWIFEEERDGYAKIYIPEGSISNDFNVDLE